MPIFPSFLLAALFVAVAAAQTAAGAQLSISGSLRMLATLELVPLQK